MDVRFWPKVDITRFIEPDMGALSTDRAHAPSVAPRANGSNRGRVKFFDSRKGFGFISCEGASDVFVHYSNITGEGYRSLDEGQLVQFAVAPGRKGDEAHDVRVV